MKVEPIFRARVEFKWRLEYVLYIQAVFYRHSAAILWTTTISALLFHSYPKHLCYTFCGHRNIIRSLRLWHVLCRCFSSEKGKKKISIISFKIGLKKEMSHFGRDLTFYFELTPLHGWQKCPLRFAFFYVLSTEVSTFDGFKVFAVKTHRERCGVRLYSCCSTTAATVRTNMEVQAQGVETGLFSLVVHCREEDGVACIQY